MKEIRFYLTPGNHFSYFVPDEFNFNKFYKEVDLRDTMYLEKNELNQFPGIVNLKNLMMIACLDVQAPVEPEVEVIDKT